MRKYQLIIKNKDCLPKESETLYRVEKKARETAHLLRHACESVTILTYFYDETGERTLINVEDF